jgi:hypothetical protein
MSGIDERSEQRANELEQEAWERAKNGDMPVVDGSCLKKFELKTPQLLPEKDLDKQKENEK